VIKGIMSKHSVISRISSRSGSAFTLVELLVVISIIALLLSIMLPVLRKVRERGRQVTCMNNMRQSYMAVSFYTGDFQGWYPSSVLFIAGQAKWISQVLVDCHYLPQMTFKTTVGSTTSGVDPLAKVFLTCPSARKLGVASRYSIGYNGPMLFGKDAPVVKVSSLRKPGGAWMWLDSDTTSQNSYVVFNTYCEERYKMLYGFPDFRHDSAMDVAYCDGHITKMAKAQYYSNGFAYNSAWGSDMSRYSGNFRTFWMGR
jgi:prepilin-type N-terminal cleavage/methylation domain-containing protein/prepilin-type processing-associated H-X9-DG protein